MALNTKEIQKTYAQNRIRMGALDAFDYFVRDMLMKGAKDDPIRYGAIGLSSESGEVLDRIKKVFYHRDQVEFSDDDLEYLKLELGDVLWYWMCTVSALGFDPVNVIEANVDKLCKRHA